MHFLSHYNIVIYIILFPDLKFFIKDKKKERYWKIEAHLPTCTQIVDMMCHNIDNIWTRDPKKLRVPGLLIKPSGCQKQRFWAKFAVQIVKDTLKVDQVFSILVGINTRTNSTSTQFISCYLMLRIKLSNVIKEDKKNWL